MKLSIVSLIACSTVVFAAPYGNGVKNVIMMVSDGFGPASETIARAYMQQNEKLPANYMSVIDKLFVGTSRTRSADSFITDSAPGAQCFSSGVKTYNNAIGVDVNIKPIGTNMEAAHRKGMKTGLVAKSHITDATPAAFAGHAANRAMQDLIAEQMGGLVPALGQNVDLMFGGGRCVFQSNSTKESCRKDTKDIWGTLKNNSWNTISTKEEFETLDSKSQLPIIGLFSKSDMPYAIDYDINNVPSLPQMAKKAIDILSEATKDSDQGFYMMIEGSRIDHAGHANDLGTHLREIFEYWETIKLVSEYIDAHPDTVMVSTSDHECGGLTLGRDNKYFVNTLTYKNQTASFETSCSKLLELKVSQRGQYVTETMIPVHLGTNVTEARASAIIKATNFSECVAGMRDALAVDANIFWTSLGHTGVDVNVYAKGKYTDELRGNLENTDIGNWLTKVLQVDVDAVTKSIQDLNVFQYNFTRSKSTLEYDHYK
ncbi:hypothetical protein BB561_006511 [Smittium simulii]|uniref:alkaline phosphatase n=1 Tax=Smittium simulii TaxID=133385 RepID=A0A2T9Y3I0_9FUNG|nr:hypothetical protein BB561_006511 [Smittium simulii]